MTPGFLKKTKNDPVRIHVQRVTLPLWAAETRPLCERFAVARATRLAGGREATGRRGVSIGGQGRARITIAPATPCLRLTRILHRVDIPPVSPHTRAHQFPAYEYLVKVIVIFEGIFGDYVYRR